MPRGKFTNHKGRSRKFTSPEELEEERRRDEQKTKWRKEHGDEESDESSEEEKAGSGSEDSDESSEDENKKAKGVSNLIEIENPNRVQKKTKKVTALKTDDLEKPQLSRREREEIEKQKAQAHYQKLHAEGKTEQARADLARLAIIKQQREEAKVRRENEQKEREDAAKAKTAATNKALGKK